MEALLRAGTALFGKRKGVTRTVRSAVGVFTKLTLSKPQLSTPDLQSPHPALRSSIPCAITDSLVRVPGPSNGFNDQ